MYKSRQYLARENLPSESIKLQFYSSQTLEEPFPIHNLSTFAKKIVPA